MVLKWLIIDLFTQFLGNSFQVEIHRVKISISTQKGKTTSKQTDEQNPTKRVTVGDSKSSLSQNVRERQNICTLL